MNKNDLIGDLHLSRQAYFLQLLAAQYYLNDFENFRNVPFGLANPDDRTFLAFTVGKEFAPVFNNSEYKKLLLHECETAARTSFINQLFESVNYYCELTGQKDIFKNKSWFHFARIVRAASSHHIVDEPIKWANELERKSITEVHWRNRTIKKGMKGIEITFSNKECYELFADMLTFVIEELN